MCFTAVHVVSDWVWRENVSKRSYEHLANYTVHTVHVCIGLPLYPPGVYDVLFPASKSVAVEDEVTVSTIEVTVEGGIHRRLCSVLNAPNLKARSQPCFAEPSHIISFIRLFKISISYLDFALAIVNHAVLGCHGLVGVQGGGVKGHLFHFRYAADGVGLTGTCSLVFVPPVTEELLEQSRLSSRWKNLDLRGKRVREGFKTTFKKLHLFVNMWKQDAAFWHDSCLCTHHFYLCRIGVTLVFDELLTR